MSGRTVAITGASGMLGSALCRTFLARGWRVHALVRPGRPAPEGTVAYACDLPGMLDESGLRGCDAVIHCAYQTRSTTRAEAVAVNERGTERLIRASRWAGAGRLVFVSSIAAHSGARSYYATSKHTLEARLNPAVDVVIRPGLVVARGGLFERLLRAIGSRGVAPIVGASVPVQAVHIDDLCGAFVRAIEMNSVGSLTIADPEQIRFGELLGLAARRFGRRAVLIPVPATLAWAGLRALEAAGVRGPFSSDSILGLMSTRMVDTRPDLRKLGISVRGAAQAVEDLPV